MTDRQTANHHDGLHTEGFGDPLYIEIGPGVLGKKESSSVIRGLFRSLFGSKDGQPEMFDVSGHAKWNEVFKFINPNSKTRKEVFQAGTGQLGKKSIIEFIIVNRPTFEEDGIDPLEFPEFADEELRPIFSTIGHTTWGHPYDGSAGHPVREKDILYNQAYLRVLLDLNDPSANKYMAETEKLKTEWMQKYPNLEISLHREKIVGSKKSPRIIFYEINMDVRPPTGAKDDYAKSNECHQISLSFFDVLNQRIAAMRN